MSKIRRCNRLSCSRNGQLPQSRPLRSHFGDTRGPLCAADGSPFAPPGGCDLMELADRVLVLRRGRPALTGCTGLNGSFDAAEVGWLAQYASDCDGPVKGWFVALQSISCRRAIPRAILETAGHEIATSQRTQAGASMPPSASVQYTAIIALNHQTTNLVSRRSHPNYIPFHDQHVRMCGHEKLVIWLSSNIVPIEPKRLQGDGQ